MENTANKRRLSAIVMADVAGYSRLMGDEEQATLRTLTAYVALLPRGAEMP